MTPEREAHFRDDRNGSYTKYERAEIWALVDEIRSTAIKAMQELKRIKHIDTLQCCCGDCYPVGSPHPDWTEDKANCGICGKEMELVRPGKHQPLCDCYDS